MSMRIIATGDPRELRERRVHDGSPETRLGHAAGFVVELDRVDLPEAAEHLEIVPGPAADLENAPAWRWSGFAPYEVGEHLPASAVPPVALVELGHLAVDAALHQPNTHCRLST